MTASPEKAAPIPAEEREPFIIDENRRWIGVDATGLRGPEKVTRLQRVAEIWRDQGLAVSEWVRADREARPSRLGCMCRDVEIGSHAVSVGLKLPSHMQEYSANRVAAGLSPDIAVDACLVGEIRRLWSKGIRTYGCCCGHNKVRGMINVHQDDAAAMRAMGYEQWPVEDGKWEWTFYPRSIEARPSLPDSREERIRAEAAEDERDRLFELFRNDPDVHAYAIGKFVIEGAKEPWWRAKLRARARQGGNNG